MVKYYSELLPNGVELPDINTVWTDKNKYPYVQIAIYTYSTPENTVSLLRQLTTEGKVSSGGLVGVSSVYRYDTNKPEKGWYQYNFSVGSGLVVWANYDVYYNDNVADVGGTLYLAASHPVPVEPEQPTLTAPADLYKIKNGVGQPQDTHKRVGNQWVPLDEYNV